jgi:hypothetical protein
MIVRCTAEMCKHNCSGICFADGITLENIEYLEAGDDQQVCKTFKWRIGNASTEAS